MKSAMEKALDKIGSVNVQKLEKQKQDKSKKDNSCCSPIPYDDRPTIYLNDKELSTIGNYKADDKVILVVECSVRSLSSYESLEGKEVKKSLNCDLRVEAIADITKV